MGLLDIFGFGKRKAQVKEALENGAIIIDVRSSAEFSSGHVKGSQNIPLEKIGGQVERLKHIKKPLVLCCVSGRRSGMAVSMLKTKGVECYNGGSWTRLH